MKRLVWIGLGLGCAAVFSANAQDAEGRKGLSEQDTQQRQAVIEKYDADSDGVLSKSEQKALSKEDKKRLAKTGGVGTARKATAAPEAKQKQDKKEVQRQANAGTKPGKPEGAGKTKSSKK